MRFAPRSIALALCALLCAAAGAPALAYSGRMDCRINGVEVSPYNGSTTADKTGIMKCKHPETGAMLREEEYRKGKSIGLYRHYDDKGVLIQDYSRNEQGNRDGRFREFHPNGKLKEESIYKNGSTVGISQRWDEAGQLVRRATYNDKGQLEGLEQTFRANGKLQEAMFHTNDGKAIARVRFNPDGTLNRLYCGAKPVLGPGADELCGYGAAKPVKHKLVSDFGNSYLMGYLDGKRVSEETFYDDGKPATQATRSGDEWTERSFTRNGVKRLESRQLEIGFEHFRRLQEQEFYRDGKLARETRWNKDGECESKKRYYNTGQLASEGRFAKQGDKQIAEVKRYYENGKLKATASFTVLKDANRDHQGRFTETKGYLGDPIGTHKHFDGDGKLYLEMQFDAASELARVREFDADGTLTRDDNLPGRDTREAYAVPR